MGSGNYDENRYSNRSYDNNQNDEEEGFFGRITHGIKDAWNSIAGDDDDNNNNNNRRGSSGTPPYNYGSGSNNAGW
jgi:hypothetical protein